MKKTIEISNKKATRNTSNLISVYGAVAVGMIAANKYLQMRSN